MTRAQTGDMMGMLCPRQRGGIVLLMTLLLMLSGCVTETTSRLAQNKNPDKAVKAYVDAGMLYMQRNKMENAHRSLKRAYDIKPDDASVNNALALFFSIEGDKKLAEKHYRQAISADERNSQARNNYAAFLFEQGRNEDAIEQLEMVTKDYLYDRRSTAFENLGVCYLKINDPEQAEQAFNRGLKLNPDMPLALLEMAQLKFDQKAYKTAAAYLASHEKLSRPSPRQLWLGIRLQQVLGDKDKQASYELALRNMFPDSTEYKAYMAAKAL